MSLGEIKHESFKWSNEEFSFISNQVEHFQLFKEQHNLIDLISFGGTITPLSVK